MSAILTVMSDPAESRPLSEDAPAAVPARTWRMFWRASLSSPGAAWRTMKAFQQEISRDPELRLRVLALRGGTTMTALAFVLAVAYAVTLPFALAAVVVAGVTMAAAVSVTFLLRGAAAVLRGVKEVCRHIYDAALEEGGLLAERKEKDRMRAVKNAAHRQRMEKTWHGRARMKAARGFIVAADIAGPAVAGTVAWADRAGRRGYAALMARPFVQRTVEKVTQSPAWQAAENLMDRKKPLVLGGAALGGALATAGVGVWALTAQVVVIPVLMAAAAVSLLTVAGVAAIAIGALNLYQAARALWHWRRVRGPVLQEEPSVEPSSQPQVGTIPTEGVSADFAAVVSAVGEKDKSNDNDNDKSPDKKAGLQSGTPSSLKK